MTVKRYTQDMAQTAAQRQKAYRARKRQQQLQARAERNCVVCGAELPTTAREEAKTCSSRCRQRLHAHPTLLTSEHGRNWIAAQERRRLGEEALTPEQRERARAWDREVQGRRARDLRETAAAAEVAAKAAAVTAAQQEQTLEEWVKEHPPSTYNPYALLRDL